MFSWMKNPMAGANSLQEYEVMVDKMVGKLVVSFTLLITVLEFVREATFTSGFFSARYAITAGMLTLLIRRLPTIPLTYRGILQITLPTVLAAISSVTDPFFLFVHYIFFALIVAVSMYFHAGMLLTYSIILNIVMLILYISHPTGLFGNNENPGDVYFVFGLMNGVIFILYHVTQWVRVLLNEVLKNADRLEHMAFNDFLTGVPNRASLLERLTKDIQWAQTNGTLLAVAALDIDNFKEINDTYGHLAGDQILVKVAERIQSFARATDTIARMGGDEFCIVLTGIRETADAIFQMNRIIDGFSSPHMFQNSKLRIEVSIGLAFYPCDGSDPQTLLNAADKAMYSAKRSGKNCLRPSEDVLASLPDNFSEQLSNA